MNEFGKDYPHMTKDQKSKEINNIRRNILGYVDEAVSEELKNYE